MKKVQNKIRSLINTLYNWNRLVSPLDIEREEYKFYINYLRPKMKVVDVGANVGRMTLIFSKFIGEMGEVYSIEPTPSTFDKLNLIIDNTNTTNVRTYNLAIGDKIEEVLFYEYPERYSSWNTIVNRPLENYGISIKPKIIKKIKTVPLDIFCEKQNIDVIDLLKIDVEGAEANILKGANRLLEEKKIKCIVFEFGQTWLESGINPNDVVNYLNSKGYNLKNILGSKKPLFTYSSNKTAAFAMIKASPK